MKQEFLESIGFTKNESKIYLALLELGKSSAIEIAKHSNIHRTNVYDTLQRLVTKGVVISVFEGAGQKFMAKDPDYIKEMLSRQSEMVSKILKK